MTRLALLSLALALPACADTTPDSDVQISCSGEHAVELCTHAANAAAELNPHLSYWVGVRDPEVVGVTWRDAEQWRIVTVSADTTICLPNGRCSTVCPTGRLGALAVTDTYRHTISVGACALDGHVALAATVRHEIGHALGVGHLAPAGVVMAERAYGVGHGPEEYTDADIEAVASVRRGERNDIIEALWID